MCSSCFAESFNCSIVFSFFLNLGAFISDRSLLANDSNLLLHWVERFFMLIKSSNIVLMLGSIERWFLINEMLPYRVYDNLVLEPAFFCLSIREKLDSLAL